MLKNLSENTFVSDSTHKRKSKSEESDGFFQSTVKTGKNGENKACVFLVDSGYEIIERNWRTRGGELDIIASKDETLVFAEVKTLPSGNPEILAHELNERKQKRITETAKCFLSKHREYSNRKIRFDVLVIDMPEFPPVYHIPNAFSELV